jgi:excisionase family DNA binding protein
VTPNKINKFPYGNQELLRAEHSERKVASCRVCNKFPYSNLGCCTAPKTGDVSGVAEGRACVQPREAENEAKKREILTASKQHLLDNHDPNVLLSTNELATLIGFRPKTIRRWVSRKFLSYIRVGNRFRFRLAAVELFLAQREVRK